VFGVPFVLDEWVGVNLPKTVFVQNYRLGLIDGFLKVCVISYVVATLFLSGAESDISSVSYAPSSIISFWSEFASYNDVVQKDMRSDLCDPAKNNKYDYGYSPNWIYENHLCTWLHKRDRAIKLEDSLFVPTYSESAFDIIKKGSKVSAGGSCSDADCDSSKIGVCKLSSNGWKSDLFDADGNCVCKCSSSKNEFAVGVEGITLHFLHLPVWPVKSRPWIKQQGLETLPKNQKEVWKGEEMVTIVRDINKKEFARFGTDEEVQLKIGDILRMGGPKGHTLDETNKVDNRTNSLIGHATHPQTGLQADPHLRITGANVNIMVSYHNTKSDQNDHQDLPGVVCYVDIEIVPRWTGLPIGDVANVETSGDHEQQISSRYYYGLKIRFIPSGKFEFFSLNKLLTYLASAIVYLTVPNFLMVLFTKFCLGTLSEMYYKAQCTLLDFWELFSGQVVRALVGLYCYNAIAAKGERQLADKQGRNRSPSELTEKNRVLEKSFLHECLVDLFEEHDGLDDDEIDTIQRVLTKVLDKAGNHTVSQQAFVEAAVNADVGNMRGWAKLFDMDRRPCCLERMFDTNIGARRAVTKKAKADPAGGGAVVEISPEEGAETDKPAAEPAAAEPPAEPVVPTVEAPTDKSKEGEEVKNSCTI